MALLQRWSNNDLRESEPYKSKNEITGKTPDNGNTKNVEIMENNWNTIKIFKQCLENTWNAVN